MSLVSCVVGIYGSQAQHIAAQAPASPRKPSQKFIKCDFVATSQAFVVKAVIICVYCCSYIVKHRAPLCVLLTHMYGNQV